MSTRNRCWEASSTSRASRPLGHRRQQPPPPGHLVSQPGEVLLVRTEESILTELDMLETQVLTALPLARLATGHLLALLTFVMALLAPLLLLGPSLGQKCGTHLTGVLLSLPVVHGTAATTEGRDTATACPPDGPAP